MVSGKTRRKLQELFSQRAEAVYTVPGHLGRADGLVDVVGTPGYVYVTMADEVIQCYADPAVPRLPGLPVMVGRGPEQPTLLQVLAVRAGGMGLGMGGDHVGNHHAQHEWPRADTVYTHIRQMLPLRLVIVPPFSVCVYPGMLWMSDGTLKSVAQSEPIDLYLLIPIAAGKARLIWFIVNNLGAVVTVEGEEVDTAALNETTLPVFPNDTEYVLGAIRLYTGQQAISEAATGTDVLDLRWPMRHKHGVGERNPGVRLYFHSWPGLGDTVYHRLWRDPAEVGGAGLPVTVVAGSPATIAQYNTEAGFPRIGTFPAGRWRFRILASRTPSVPEYLSPTTTRAKFEIWLTDASGFNINATDLIPDPGPWITAYTAPIDCMGGFDVKPFEGYLDLSAMEPIGGYTYLWCKVSIETDSTSPVAVYYSMDSDGTQDGAFIEFPGFTPGRLSDHTDARLGEGYDTGVGIMWDASEGGYWVAGYPTPGAHAPTHKSGGTDPLKLDELAEATDTTDLNATVLHHGLLPKLDGYGAKYLDGTGGWSIPAGGGGTTLTVADTPSVDLTYTGGTLSADQKADWTAALTNKTINSNTNYVDADATHIKVFNNSGGAIAMGQAVYAVVWNAANSAIEVKKAQANNVGTMPALGLAETAIADGAVGEVRTSGVLTGFDTSIWSDGASLYVSPTTAGALTATEPTAAGQYSQKVAIVVRQHATLGVVAVVSDGDAEPTILPASRGGTGKSNAGTLTIAANVTIDGGGTIHLNSRAAEVPADGILAMRGVGVEGKRVAYWNTSSYHLDGNADFTWDNTLKVLAVNGSLLHTGSIFESGDDTPKFGAFTLTVPATGTLALLEVQNTFTTNQYVSMASVASTPTLSVSLNHNRSVNSADIPVVLSPNFTDTSTQSSGNSRLSAQVMRLSYTKGAASTGLPSAFDAGIVVTSTLNADMNNLYGVYVEGANIATGKTLGTYAGLRISSTAGAGSVTTKRSIVTDVGAGNASIGDSLGVGGITSPKTTLHTSSAITMHNTAGTGLFANSYYGSGWQSLGPGYGGQLQFHSSGGCSLYVNPTSTALDTVITPIYGWFVSTLGNVVIGSSTDGMLAGGSLGITKDLVHRGANVGLYGVTPVARPTAYTQTYSTAARTVPAATALTPPAGGTGTAAGGWDTAANRNLAITSITATQADLLALKKVVNSIIDDLQAIGILQ